MATKKQDYGNDSISALKGADRVRKRPGVIFGSDGLEGCEHAVFEILSNSIDEAREGHGRTITVTRFADRSIQVEDAGRGCPVDWNEKEQRYNWELVFCELYAGGKYNTNEGESYEYSLGLNGLGACATQYSSEYFDAVIRRDGKKYTLHFETLPPTLEGGFWSVTAYGEDDFLIDNSIDRYCINDRSDFKLNADSTLDIILSKDAPEDTSNWLPVSDGEFHLFMRIYVPDMTALDSWQPPVIREQ